MDAVKSSTQPKNQGIPESRQIRDLDDGFEEAEVQKETLRRPIYFSPPETPLSPEECIEALSDELRKALSRVRKLEKELAALKAAQQKKA